MGVRILPFLQMKSIVVEMRGGVQILSLRRGLFLMAFVPANAGQATRTPQMLPQKARVAWLRQAYRRETAPSSGLRGTPALSVLTDWPRKALTEPPDL